MEAFLAGLNNLMDPHVLIAIALGSIGGLMIGAVPGIGPAIAIAILLPATVFLEDLVSLVLLLGVYGASMYGGAIPAILINTPGTPVNALTTYDGFALTRRGEAGRALSLAYAGRYPEQVSGVINFVGGWMGDRCKNAVEINGSLFQDAAGFPQETL